MSHGPKLTVQGQIEHMKSQGITFSIVSEAEALQYQRNAMYYFFEQRAKELPDNWLDELDLEYNEEEGE